MDPQFNKFKLSGQIYFWKYRANSRNYPGWNMTCDKIACDSLVELFQLMSLSKFSSEVTVPVNKPKSDHLHVVNNGSQIQTVETLTFKYNKEFEKSWQIQKSEDNLRLIFDTSYLLELKESILKIKSDEGDFALSDNEESDDSILYFWWHPKI